MDCVASSQVLEIGLGALAALRLGVLLLGALRRGEGTRRGGSEREGRRGSGRRVGRIGAPAARGGPAARYDNCFGFRLGRSP
mgnify:CR=1 FL=1